MLVVGGVCHGIQQRKVWWQKPVHHRNMTYFMDCWHQVVRILVYPSNTKSKKIHSGLLQFAVKVICTMLHVCMVWGLQNLSNTSTRKSVKKHNLLLMKVYSETDTHASGWWCVPWNSTKESLQMAPSHCSPHSSVVKFPVGSPYDFGVCELVDVLMHAPHSRVWCQTLGLCDSRFYKFCLTPQQKVDKSCSIYPF